MKNSDRAMAQIHEHEAEENKKRFCRAENDRKRSVYWVGFLSGTLSSHRIEEGEQEALLAEAEKFREFFDDPDADDFAEDLRAECFSSEQDLITQIKEIIKTKRSELMEQTEYSETDEMNEFLGFCAGIICDGKILEREARAILDRFSQSTPLMTAAPFRQLRRAVEAAMADDVLTPDEAEEIQEWISQLVGDGFIDTGIPNIVSVAKLDDPITDANEIRLAGSRFVLTGPMKMGTRSFIKAEIERIGGIFDARTTQKTDYVVVSSNASRDWRTTHFGTKIERAKELIDQGHNLRFVSEDALSKAIAARDEESRS